MKQKSRGFYTNSSQVHFTWTAINNSGPFFTEGGSVSEPSLAVQEILQNKYFKSTLPCLFLNHIDFLGKTI